MKLTPIALCLLFACPAFAAPDEPEFDAIPWEKIAKEAGVTVYTKEVPGSDLVAFKGVTTIWQPLGKVLSVLMDNDRRTEWVDRLVKSEVLEEISDHEYILYQHFGLPFIMSDRDYVYHGKATRNAQGQVTLAMNSCEFEGSPETIGVRAELVRSRYVLTPKGEKQTTISVEIQTDPKGMIPTWLVNLIQKTWPAKTLKGVRKQASRKDVEEYPLPPVTTEAENEATKKERAGKAAPKGDEQDAKKTPEPAKSGS